MTMDFDCNGLNPTVKSWGTANHVKIWDGTKTKTIDCGKPRVPAYYSTSDSIFVQIQINAAGYGEENGYKGGKMRIMYQSVRQKGTPILKPKKPTPTQPMKTILPRHQGRILNPQDPAILNNPNHIQHPKNRNGLMAHTNTHHRHHQQQQQRPQVTYQQPQAPQQPQQQPQSPISPVNQLANLPPNTIILDGQIVQLKKAVDASDIYALGRNFTQYVTRIISCKVVTVIRR